MKAKGISILIVGSISAIVAKSDGVAKLFDRIEAAAQRSRRLTEQEC